MLGLVFPSLIPQSPVQGKLQQPSLMQGLRVLQIPLCRISLAAAGVPQAESLQDQGRLADN